MVAGPATFCEIHLVSGRLPRAILVGVIASLAAALVELLRSGAWWPLALGLGLFFFLVILPMLGLSRFIEAFHLRRQDRSQAEPGGHYSFGNVKLAIEDDGRHVWVAAADLQRALHTTDTDEVIAARHAGRWRRNPRGQLQLRVDTVVQVLSTAPGRMDPHTIHLRRYLEREVLFPATRQRERRGGEAR